MYECIQVGQNTFYLDSPSKVGIYRPRRMRLADSTRGATATAQKRRWRQLEALGLRLEAAVVTHYHADHTGGAALLQQRTGCRLLIAQPLAPAAYPEINTALLYGAHPPKPLRGKFFLAPQADYEDAEQAALPEGMELVRLDGHAFAMLGVRTPDGVWFIGDSLAGEKTLEKYKLTYLYDVEKYLRSLERVSTLQGEPVRLGASGAGEGRICAGGDQPPLGRADGRLSVRGAADADVSGRTAQARVRPLRPGDDLWPVRAPGRDGARVFDLSHGRGARPVPVSGQPPFLVQPAAGGQNLNRAGGGQAPQPPPGSARRPAGRIRRAPGAQPAMRKNAGGAFRLPNA